MRLAILAVLVLAGGQVDRTSIAAGQLPRTANDVIVAMLRNIHANGFNAHPAISGGLGGLWINWRTGTRPLATNWNGTGNPDGPEIAPPRHDGLTDLRFLHALLLYKHQHKADPQFDADVARMAAIVKKELESPHNERGWIYDELIEMGNVSGDPWYHQAARGLAEFYADKFYRPGVGLVYKTSSRHPHGYYRVDLALEAGCALIQAGTVFHEPTWTTKGREIVKFVREHAYVPKYRMFLHQMDDVLLPDGKVNPNERIVREKVGHTNVDGGLVRMGEIGQSITSLLHVYLVTRDTAWLQQATDMLDQLTADRNALGLWDGKNLGYFNGIAFPGLDAEHPGEPHVTQGKKESGRQFHMLQAFHAANAVTGKRYAAMEALMRKVALEKAYFPEGQGIVYEVAPDWSLLTMKNGQRADWVTTEAMGVALLALLELDEEKPW